MTKSERTAQYILETVAPVFNRNGYVGTSMSELTEATGLTKGAIYGNFKGGKEELAVAVFNYTVRRIMWKMAEKINAQPTATAKFKAITSFYRGNYVKHMDKFGGCTILNTGVDAHYLSPALFARVKEVIGKLKRNLAVIVQEGIDSGEFKPDLNPDIIGSRIYAMIQGSIFLTTTLDESAYIDDMMDQIDRMIETDITT